MKKWVKKRWDKPITRRGWVAIYRKLEGYEKKYGWKSLHWALNKYLSIKKQNKANLRRMAELEKELKKLKEMV